ncbi:hypothetical protein L7F22_051075 [Adiantum nelumboides]|nr:hypothetical protein [Adiantum nelumboides]
MAAAAGAAMKTSSGIPVSQYGLCSSFLPPLRLRSRSCHAMAPGLALRSRFSAAPSPRRPLHISASLAATQTSSAPAEPPKASSSNIWLSGVPTTWKKPYFLNRSWSASDIAIGIYLVLTHLGCLLAPFHFTWKAFGVFLCMYVITGLFGITLSYHRNLSHKSVTLPKWLEYTCAYCGVLALQGDPLEWVSSHRYHHQHCDTEKDPHSPYGGFWFSHMWWVIDSNQMSDKVGVRNNVADLAKQPFYRFLQKTYPLHGILAGILLYAWGGLPFLIWGGTLRVTWVYHITWLVNSACHVWGQQAWKTGDLSKNNWWVGILAFGEGWHNNHHAFEYSARHGLEWWQLDLTWYVIFALEKMGLAKNVKLPTKEHKLRFALDPS